MTLSLSSMTTAIQQAALAILAAAAKMTLWNTKLIWNAPAWDIVPNAIKWALQLIPTQLMWVILFELAISAYMLSKKIVTWFTETVTFWWRF